jgi:hypothetical protein
MHSEQITYHTFRPTPKAKYPLDAAPTDRYLPVVESCSILRSFSKRNPSNSWGLESILSSVWVELAGMETIAPAGTVTPSENVRGNWEEAESGSVSRIWGAEEGVQRTGDETRP